MRFSAAVNIAIGLPPIASIECPFRHVRQGRALRLIVGNTNITTDASRQAILKAIARARLWYEQITTGQARSICELAGLHGISPRFIVSNEVDSAQSTIDRRPDDSARIAAPIAQRLARHDPNELARAAARPVRKVRITSTPILPPKNSSSSQQAACIFAMQKTPRPGRIMQSPKSQISPVPFRLERELPKLPTEKCRQNRRTVARAGERSPSSITLRNPQICGEIQEYRRFASRKLLIINIYGGGRSPVRTALRWSKFPLTGKNTGNFSTETALPFGFSPVFTSILTNSCPISRNPNREFLKG